MSESPAQCASFCASTLTSTQLALLEALNSLMERFLTALDFPLAVEQRSESTPSFLGKLALIHLQTGGKRLRARLALAVSEILGGVNFSASNLQRLRDTKFNPAGLDAAELNLFNALSLAAACELIHNATLVHDDLQDGDTLRRGQPTIWTVYGAAQAINLGDFLFMLPFKIIQDLNTLPVTKGEIVQAFARAMLQVISGQAEELLLNQRFTVEREHYLQVVTGKTSALFALPALTAALLAGVPLAEAQQIGEIFGKLGVIFQIQDDILDLYGTKGRAVEGSDIYEGKISALIIEHLLLYPAERPWLQTILQTPREATQAADVTQIITRLKEGGALKQVLLYIRELTAQLRTEPIFKVYPALKPLWQALLETMLKPIAHLETELS